MTSWADRALDVAMLGMALGASLNLAGGQGSLALCALILLVMWLRGDERMAPAVRELGAAWSAPVVFLVVCALSNVLTRAAWPGFFDATRYRPLLAIPVGALALAIRGDPLARRCAMVFAAGCALHAAIGLYQVTTGNAPFADLLAVAEDHRHQTAPDRPDAWSAVGLFYNRVRLSHVLAAGVAVALMLARHMRAWRSLILVGAGLSFAGLMFTYGRAALLALLLTLGAWAVLEVLESNPQKRASRVRLAVTGLSVMFALVMMVEPARARLMTAVSFSHNQDRLFLWGRGAEMAMDHAPVGTGFGGYAMVRDAYYNRVNDSIQSRTMSHNLLLSLLAETGILGLTSWLWMWWALWSRARATQSAAAWAGVVGAATFHLATLAHDPLYQSECALAWGFCGALMAAPRALNPPSDPPP